MVLVGTLSGGASATTAGAVENYQRSATKVSLSYYGGVRHTNGLQEERIVIEVVLDKENVALVLVSGALHHDIQRTLRKVTTSVLHSTGMCSTEVLTSSSMSKNATERASCTPMSGSASFFTTCHPRRPDPSELQPATPFAHGTERTR